MPSYDTELTALHDSISHGVSVLLADSANSVKQSLMEHSVTKLAVFFGKQKANDVILSHMITFLNDKEDPQLRLSFYENIIGVAAFVGWQCSPILLPLLLQGLSDPEEFVISRCINTMASLTSLQLLQKVALYELLKETTPYLLHPNLWIRQATGKVQLKKNLDFVFIFSVFTKKKIIFNFAAAAFVSSTASTLDGVDVVVKLGSILAPFLKHSVVQMDNSALILANVESHIPRPVLDGVIKTPNDVLQEFLNLLEERQTARSMSKTNIQVLYSEMPPNIKPLFRRLASEGMVPNVEDKLLFMKENLIKISKHRAMKQSNVDEYFAVLDLNTYNKVIKRCIPLNIQEKSDLEMAQDSDVVVGGEWNAGTLDHETGIEQAETAESGTTPNESSRKSISEEVPDYPAFLHETKTSCKYIQYNEIS